MLNIMEQFPLGQYPHNSADALHIMIEAKKLAYSDMYKYVGDPRFTPVPVKETRPWRFSPGGQAMFRPMPRTSSTASSRDRWLKRSNWVAGRTGVRRLVELEQTDCRVAYPLKLIARLYRIEHLADALGLTPDDRVVLRRERSAPVLEQLQRWCVVTHRSEPPSTNLAKATGYLLNHWQALSRFLEDGRIDLDNNLTEQQLRDIALGRNYLFAGSHEAARRAANLYSLTRTCAQNGVPPLPYFTEMLQKLGSGWSVTRLEELLPHRWSPTNVTQPHIHQRALSANRSG